MTDAATLTYAMKGAQVLGGAQKSVAAADTGDSSLTVRGCAACCADWTKHVCGFFTDCLMTPSNLKLLADREHLLGTGHGLRVPTQAWICVNFYLGLAYNVLGAIGAVFSLELATFLPAFIMACLYTTVGSYSWYWACISGDNTGCCLLWIKGLVLIEFVHICMQFFEMYDSSCTMSASESDEVTPDGDADCSTGAIVKFFKFIVLLVTVIPSVGLFYFGLQCCKSQPLSICL